MPVSGLKGASEASGERSGSMLRVSSPVMSLVGAAIFEGSGTVAPYAGGRGRR